MQASRFLALFAVLLLVSAPLSADEINDAFRIRLQPMAFEDSEGQSNLVPSSTPYLCSGFAVKTAFFGTYFFTAGHCLPNPSIADFDAEGIKVDKLYFVIDDGIITLEEGEDDKSTDEEATIRQGNAVEVDLEKLKGSSIPDVGYMRIKRSEKLKLTETHKIAKKPLEYGDKASIVGYPGGYGPVTYDCTYVGKGIRPGFSFDYLMLRLELLCPALLDREGDVAGISGGAVLNEAGKIVGIVNEQLRSAPAKRGEIPVMARIGFVPLTRENVSSVRGVPYEEKDCDGTFRSKYLDWTIDEEITVEYTMKDCELHGVHSMINSDGEVFETLITEMGRWGL